MTSLSLIGGQSKEFFKIQHILIIVKVFCTKFECNMTIKSQNTWCPVIRVKVNYNSDVIGFILICSAKILYLAAFIYHEGTMYEIFNKFDYSISS